MSEGSLSNSAVPAAAGVDPVSIAAFVAEQWPAGPVIACHEVSGRHVVVSQAVPATVLRPGGFVSGPTQFAVADMALWYACFGAIGLEAMAMTSELSIRYLRPAVGETLWGRAELQSVGSKTIVGSVTVWTTDQDRPTSVSQGSYALPS